jgi:hypothetical protein
MDGMTSTAFRHNETWYTPALFTWKLPPDDTDTIVDDPLTVQPFELVMAIRNVFDVTGFDKVVVLLQFIKSPALIVTLDKLDKSPPSP